MRSYQSVLILKPDLDEGNVDQAVEKITALIQKHSGEVLRLEKWGKKRLAYKVKKNKFGYYLNIYHTCGAGEIPALEKEYKLMDVLIKFLVIVLDEKELERAMSRGTESGEEGEESKASDGEGEKEAKKEPVPAAS
ncbi:putative 30S ribosomal protein S6 [Nitrospina gracilis 3/211]|uniref:Small ribosomal subunit protein bS6 n=1 Tax=Nitrospina gracilis (strain 3/211) TaxID=1266370 RepID=M1Z1D4_NITG3|nr:MULTISPECIES: 30S ribosomal protein S6 [Nitrospina]MCF8724169.1 small subunit ribosomal protein S6 [Nitrospina sp. Nb-3]CCQ91315.1 putative 30S ribosomal protein S6 [Nitrospina gracilis 3/211]